MPNDNLKNLYTYLTTQKKIELPDYNTFENDMQNESNLNGFYKNITDRKIELPPYDVFVSDMGLKKKDNSGEDYPNLVKVQSGSSQENNIPLSGTLASEFIPSKSQGSGAKTTQSDVATENKIDLSIAEKKIEGYRQSEFVSPEENADWEKAIKRKRELKSNIITKTKPIVRDYIDRLKPTIESSADKSLAYDEIETQLSKKFDKQTVKEALKDYQQNDIEEKAAKLIESNNLTDITYLPDRYVEEVKGYLRGEGYKDEAVENAVSNITRNASKYELETKGIKTLKDEAKQTALRLGISKEDIAPFEEQYITQKAIDNTHNFFGEQELEKMQKQIQLNKLMDNPNKTVDDRVKINKLNQEIAEKYPNPIRMYNAFGEAYTDQNTIQEKTQQVNALENEYKISFKDKLKQGFLEKYAAYNQALNNHNEIIKPITSGSSADRLIKQSDPDIIARVEKSSQVLDKAQMEYIAMSKLYLLNESAANVKKDVGFYASGAVKAMVESFASSVGAENVAKKLPKTDRDLLNSIDMVMSDNDIKKSPLEAEKIEQGLFEQTLNATSSIVGILPSLMALNKAQGLIGLTGIIGRLTAAERTVKTAEGLYKLEKNPIFSKVIGHALGAMAEEAKMQAIGSETGVGTGFYLGVKTGFGLPIKGKYSAILKPYFDKLVGGSIGGTIGMETGEVAKELSGALFNDKDLDYRLKEMYPSIDVFGKRMIVNLISNSLLGVTHLSKTDLTSNPEVLKKMSLEYKVKASELRKEGKESEADSHEQLAKVIDNKAKNIEKDGEDKPMPLYEPAERKVITVEAREEKPTYIINGEKKTKEEVIEYAEKNKGEENTDKIEVINDTETADKVETILTKIDDAVGKDIDYNGIDGILIKEDDGFYVLGDNGEKTLIESGESGKSISDLGIKVFPEITEADINNAVKDAEQLGEVEYKGKKYFVATANPMKENSIGDKVFQMNDDGSIKREMGGTSGNDKKQSIVNKFISEKGLPKRTTDNTVKPKEPKVEGETKGVNEGVNIATKPEKVAKNSLEVPEPVKATKTEVIQEEKPEIKSETLHTEQKTVENPALKDVVRGDVKWNNTGTEFKDNKFLKDGKTFSVKAGWNRFNRDLLISVLDENGKEVSVASFKQGEDGKFYSERTGTTDGSFTLKDFRGKGLMKSVYDFVDKNYGEVKPSKNLTNDGLGFWESNRKQSIKETPKAGSVGVGGDVVDEKVVKSRVKRIAKSLNVDEQRSQQIHDIALKAKDYEDFKNQVGDLIGDNTVNENRVAETYTDIREEAKSEYEKELERNLEDLRASYGEARRADTGLKKITEKSPTSVRDFINRILNGTTPETVAQAKARLVEMQRKYRKEKADMRAMLPRERGVNFVIEKLSKAAGNGDISQEGADLAIDLIRKQPNMFEDLAISITQGNKELNGDGVQGWYRAADALVKIFKNPKDPLTATHEILHHTERFLPQEVRDGITKEWHKQVQRQAADFAKQLKTETDLDKRQQLTQGLLYLGLAEARQTETNYSNVEAMERIMSKYLGDHTDSKGNFHKGLGDSWYQLYNPSEWWAVNASKIFRDAQNKPELRTWTDKAKAFYNFLIDSAKKIFKGNPIANVEKGLRAILKGEALEDREGTMLSQSKRLLNIKQKGTFEERLKSIYDEVNKNRATENKPTISKEQTEPIIEPEQKSQFKSIADEIRKGKIGDDVAMGSLPFAKEVWNTAIETLAKSVEVTGDITKGINDAVKYIKKTDWYKKLNDKERKKRISEFTDKFGTYVEKVNTLKQQIAEESGLKKSRDIVVDEMKALKNQFQSQNKGAKLLKESFNKIFSERAKELTNIGITAKHTRTLLNKIVGDGSKAIEWFDKLIADKDYANDYSLATDIQKEIITKIKNGDFSDVSRIRAEMLSNYDVSELTKEHLKEFVTDMNSLLTSGEYAAETVALAFDKVSKYPELNAITPEETTIQKVTKITDILDEKYDIVKMLANKMKKLGEKNIVVTPYNIVNEYLKLVDTKINKIGQLASENGYLYDYVTGQFMRFDSKTKELVFDREMEGISKEYKELLEESKNYEKAIEKFNQSTDAEVKISKQEYEDILKDEKNAVIKNITNMSSKINRSSFINNAHKKLADKFIGLSSKILDKMTPKQLNMVEKAVSDLLFQNVTKHTHDTLNEINAVKTGEKLQKPLNTLMESFLGKEWGSKNLRKRNIKEITNILSVRAVSQLDAVWNTYLTDNNKVNFKRAMKILVGSDIHRTNKGFFSELYRPYADALQKYNRHLAEYQKGLAENLFIGKWESAKRPFKGDFDAFLKSSGLTNKEVAEVGVVLRQLDYYFNDILKNTNASDLKTMIDKGKTKDQQTYADNKWVQDALFHVLDLSKLKSEFVSGRKNAKYETISGTKEDKALHEAYDSLIDKNKGGLGDLTSEAKALSLLNKNQIKLYKFYRDLMSKNRDMADAVATMQGRSLNERDYYSALYSMESLEIADVSKLNPFARKPKMKTGNTIDREAFGVKKYDPNVFRNMDRWMEDMGKNFFVDNAIKEVNKTLDKIKEQSTPENEVFISSFIGAVKQDFNNRVLVEFTQQNASAFTNWVASKTGMYTLASPVRVPAELLSNFMQHPFTNTSEIIKSIQAGGFVKEYSNMRSIANEFGSYTFEKEIDMSKHLEKVQATSQTQTWAGEILQSGVKGMITVSDKLVRPLLFAGTIHQMFEARTGEKFNAEKFVIDKEYKEKHKELVKELVEEADIQVQDDYMDYNKSLQAYELKSLLPKNTINKYSGFGKSMSWIASFPIKQGIRQMDAAKTLITGTPEQKLKATRTIAAIQMQNIIYFATMNAVSNAMALGIAKLTGNKKEEEYALERMKDISSGKFWAENVMGNLVQTPINQYGSFARLGLGILAMFYKMNEYDESGMSESQKKKAKDEAQQFSSSLFNYGVKVPNIRFENEKEAFGDLIESLPLYGALGKMGFDFMGVGVELKQIGDEKYEATKEMQKDIAKEQVAVAAAHIINLASRSTVIPKDIVKLIDSEIKQDKIEKSKKRKMIE